MVFVINEFFLSLKGLIKDFFWVFFLEGMYNLRCVFFNNVYDFR